MAQPAGGGRQQPHYTSAVQPAHLEVDQYRGTLFGMNYETWFTENRKWSRAEAIPILGKYSSYNVGVIEKHASWFEDLGVNWLLVDWSNMLWMKPAWKEQKGAVRRLEKTTELLFDTYSRLQQEGQHPPKIVLLLGLQNGPAFPVNGIPRLREVFNWINDHLLSNPRYKDLWLYYGGKPLITVWYSPHDACQRLPTLLKAHPLQEPRWTVRWENEQFQETHNQDCGMWSHIDGTIRKAVVYRKGRAEETVVSPSALPPGGWLSQGAVGRDHGVPYLESWKVAFQARPKFVMILQWNEFVGQRKGKGYGPQHNDYKDQYNEQLSNDIEPTKLHACAYRGCGGWGYYYLNLTEALISLYRGDTPGITVMALSDSSEGSTVKTKKLVLRWTVIGKQPASYSLRVDGKLAADKIHGTRYTLDLSGLSAGMHSATLVANDAYTYFNLDPNEEARRSEKPLPVTSTVKFEYAPSQR